MKTVHTMFVPAILLLLLVFVAAPAIAQLTEGFETGLPTTAPTTETNYTLSSGIWSIMKGLQTTTKHGGTYALRLNSGNSGGAAYATAPALATVSTVTVWARGSGASTLTIQKSVNGGAFTTVASQAITSTYASYTITVNETGGNVRIRLQNSTSQTHYIDDIVITSSTPPAAVLTVNPTSRAFGNVVINTTSAEQTYALTGTSLTPASGNITITAPTGYQVSATTGSGFASSISVAYASSVLAAKTIYVRFAPIATQAYNGNISNAGGGATTVNVSVTGTGVTTATPALTVSPTSLSLGSVVVNTNSSEITYSIAGTYLTPASGNITITAPTAFQISATSGSGYASSIIVAYASSTLAAKTIYLRFTPTAVQSYSGNITNAGGGATAQNVAVSGSGVSTPPAGTYYVSPTGNDANSGSISAPLKNLQVAVNKMVAGDVVYLRGGTYYPDYMQDSVKTTIRITKSGTASSKMCIYAYPGETPILNFSSQPKAAGIRGILLSGNYWHIKGITIREAGDNGMKLEGNYNIIEKCIFCNNDDSGLQLGFGHVFADSHPGISSNDGSYCAYNDIVDCDSYLNYDTDNRGSDADGFSCKMHNGKKNRFIRCRSWDNADDAWDLYETDYPVYIIECWAWGSGRASNFNVVGGSFQGNGNGMKLGGNGSGGNSQGKHEVWYSFAFNNNKTTSVKGFDQNSHQGGVKIINCVSFGNGYDYMFETASGTREFYNDIAFGKIEIASGTIQGNNAIGTNPTKGWTNNVCSTFTAADFNSLTEANAKSARGSDGSLPTSFGRLVAGSVLIDKGTVVSNGNAELSDLGLPRASVGTNRDLGAYEYGGTPKASVEYTSGAPVAPYSFSLMPNYPNPFNPSTTIQFHVASEGPAILKVFNTLGQEVATLFSDIAEPGRLYSVQFRPGQLASGIYFSVLESGTERQVIKMTFMK
jgi:pectate disaccharide-lyase